MKKIFICFFLIFSLTASAQSSKKPVQKKQPASKQEIKKVMPEEEEDIDPEGDEVDKMIDDAIKKTSKDPAQGKKQMNALPNELNNNQIPKLSKKIIRATPATEATLLTDLKAMLTKAEAGLDPQIKNKLVSYAGNARQTGYEGVALWMDKQPDAALYLMLKACTLDPGDLVLLNNFSTCLSMSGLPDKAIPMLDYLKNNLPENATVLNNLGQAWLSLGNISNAKSLLEKAVKYDTTHPEANYSLSLIAARQGNNPQCAGFLDRSMEGSVNPTVYGQWSSHPSAKHPADIIRNHFKKFYKETPITKRWRLPGIPSSVKQAQEQDESILQFFQDLGETLNDISSRLPDILESTHQKETEIINQQNNERRNLKTLDDINRFHNKYRGYAHPLKFQAQLMFNSFIDDSYSNSFSKRLEQEEAARTEKIKALNNSLKAITEQITAINKQIDKIEGGENTDEEKQVQELQKKACALQKKFQIQELAGKAEINNQYIAKAEDLLNQKLQEELFWTALYHVPDNPYPYLYKCYEDYLKAIYKMRGLYPIPARPEIICEIEKDYYQSPQVTGELQFWEDSHCPVDIDWDVYYSGMTFNCKEVKIWAKYKGVGLDWTRKVDRETWETTESEISVTAGKEFEKKGPGGTKGSIGVEEKVTVKLDGNYIPVDLIVKGSVGVEVSAPGGIKAGTDIGSVEISVSSGMRGEGPVPGAIGKMFGN